MNLTEYHGAISLAELDAVADYFAANTSLLKRDTLGLVLPGAHFGDIALPALDDLFRRYAAIYAPLNFEIIRRSAWVCLSPSAQAHIDYWIGGRDTRGAMSSTLRQFSSLAEAGDWLVLSEAETAMLESGESFLELARFAPAPDAPRARAR